MKLHYLILPGAAVAMAALILAPSESQGFSTIGGKLGLGQRDVRVFNNFTDTATNNNTTQTADWPGYDGAELALWKGAAEWGSEPHGGTGTGDPSQAAVGSGAANFDVTWQGNASGVGTTNDNIMSEIAGGSGGVLAFCETPINDGWRIRFYQSWTWADGPGSNIGFGQDLQGVGCHEYGHALGLGHSTAGGATMSAFASGNGVPDRSINSDDAAGVQSIYSALDWGKKPRITSVAGNGQPFVITGTQFLTTADNEVWFTQAGIGGNGTPVKVTGLTSTNGTTLTVFAPVNAGPGDMLIRKTTVTGPKGLSNPWPVIPEVCSGSVVTYCTAGTSANGCQATLSSTGAPSTSSGSPFSIDVNNVEGAKDGLMFFGTAGRQANTWGSGTSFQCVVPPVKRTGLQVGNGTAGLCDGAFTLDFNAWMTAHPAKAPAPGVMVNVQTWYRDPQNTSNQTTSLSDAIEFVVCN